MTELTSCLFTPYTSPRSFTTCRTFDSSLLLGMKLFTLCHIERMKEGSWLKWAKFGCGSARACRECWSSVWAGSGQSFEWVRVNSVRRERQRRDTLEMGLSGVINFAYFGLSPYYQATISGFRYVVEWA